MSVLQRLADARLDEGKLEEAMELHRRRLAMDPACEPAHRSLMELLARNEDYFVDGITEDITTALSRFGSLLVIARASAFAYRDRDLTVQQIGRELEAQFIVQGSVRRAGARVRINIQLVDATSGKHVWAQKFDREPEDVFLVQDEISATVVSTLAGRVEASRLAHARRLPPERLDTYDYVLRGKDHHHRYTAEDCQKAIEMFERAIERDPNFAPAHAWLACGLGQARAYRPDEDEALIALAQQAAEHARELDKQDAESYRILAHIAMIRHDLASAQSYQERGLLLNPNDDRQVCAMGQIHCFRGHHEESATWIRKAMRLNPYHPDSLWQVLSAAGLRVRLIRPLDFLVVADHAENLGLAPMIAESNPELFKNEWGRRVHDLVKAGKGRDAFQLWLADAVTVNKDPISNPKMTRTVWERQIAFAEEYNEPGQFTALIGFEWSSIATSETPGNLHRVVIFKDGGNKVGRVLPFSTVHSNDLENLWEYMAAYEEKTGGSVLAIAHNGNVSNGQMFPLERLNGQPIDRAYAEARIRWEPLYEVTQMKGDGEAHPFLSPKDEFADYGTWDKGDIAGLKPKEDWMLQYEYARTALQVGLQQEQKLGVNPYKFGMIGSTDAHTSLATTRDENTWSKTPTMEPSPDRWEHVVIGSVAGNDALTTYSYETLASGLAGVWARENTREALFEAMQKKETYATTGTRLTVRLFGGWDYGENDAYRPDAVAIGYSKGVPMGGDLPKRPVGKDGPTFLVGALKDPWSGNLDRIQIIKGWMDEKGERHEKVYDVAVSDGRSIGPDGRCKHPVGNTVDEADATYLNNIGDAELRAVWTDPDFDPDQRAVYYARVLEIPTPTWQAYDAKFFSITMPEAVPLSHQERAYTSPIWFTP